MGKTVSQILEGTTVLIILFLVVKNAGPFSQVINAIGSVYQGSVKQLQGG